MAGKRWLLRVSVVGLAVLVALAVSAGGLLAFLHTQTGRDFLANRIALAASDDATRIRIDRLEGSVASSFRIEKITVADREGLYATISNARVTWRPFSLLKGALDIESVSVEQFAVDRPPRADSAAEPASLQEFLPGIDVRAGTIEITEIALAAPVLGEAQRLSASASGHLDAKLSSASLKLSLRPMGDGNDKADISFDYATRPARFEARTRIEGQAGGVIAKLAGLPAGHPLLIDLSGDGPPEAWQGALKLEAGPATANAAVTVALQYGAASVSIDGTADANGLVSPHLRSYLTPSGQFRAEAEFIPADRLTVRHLSLQTEELKLSGAGRYDISGHQVSAKASIVSSSPISLPNEARVLSIGQAGVDATLEGSLEAPRMDLSVQMQAIEHGSARIASVTGVAAFVPNSKMGFDVNGAVKTLGVETGGLIPASLLGETVDLTVSGQLQRDVTFQDVALTVTSGPVGVEIAGQFDPAAQSLGQFSIHHEKIESIALAAGVALDGTFEAEGTFRADASEKSISVTSSGKLSGFSGGHAELRALLEKDLSFVGTGNWRDGAPLEIIGLEVTTAFGQTRADGMFNLATGTLNANIELEVLRLQDFSALAGKSLAGRATASATIDGTAGGLTARGQAFAEGLQAESQAVGNIGVGYLARLEDETLTAALRLGGDIRGKPLTGSADARFGKGEIALSAIDLTIGKNRLSGTLGFAPDRQRLAAALEASLDDIGDIPGADAFSLVGSGHVRLTSDAQRKDEITLTANLKELVFGHGTEAQVSLDTAMARIKLQTPFSEPVVAGEVSVDNVSAAGMKRGQARLKVSGNISALDWSATASLDGPYPVSVAAVGGGAHANNTSRLFVETLKGEIAGQPIALRAPFSMTAPPQGWRIEPVDISFANGRFRFAGSLIDGTVEADGQLDDLPVGVLSLINPRLKINGAIRGTARASGPASQPAISISLMARDMRPLDMSKEEFAGFAMSLNADQSGDKATVTVKFSGPADTDAAMAINTHPLLSFDPPSIALNRSLPLSGTLKATGRLDLIDQLIGLGEDRITGRLAANAKLSGTLDVPIVHGEARLNEASYEGVATGSLLRNIEGHATFTGENVQLVSLTADDGAAGRLSGKGTVRFSDSADPSGGIELSLARFSALRHPLAEIVTTGTLALTGSLQAPRLAGQLRVDQGEIRIPDALPQSIVNLDVVEINGDAVGIDTSVHAIEPSAGAAFPVALDVAIEFPGQTFVRGRGLDSEWKGQLNVKGTSQTPNIAGKLQAVRGTFAFAGRTFVIKQGSVFLPDAAAEPEIEAVAEAKLTDIVAQVEISGSISKPSISVSSDPSLPQEDVLAHILFGRTSGQLSAIQAAQLAQTAATLSGRGGAGIVDKIRQALGVDVLNVESQDGDAQGASLKAGKYLREDVFLSVSQGTQPGSQKVGVEVQVFPNVTVESNVSGDADSNIGLNWKWDY